MINEELLIQKELGVDMLSDEEQVDEREADVNVHYSRAENYDEEKYIKGIMIIEGI